MTRILNFKSAGKIHPQESDFFKFLVNQAFSSVESKVIQWCKIDGLTVTVTSASDDILKWAYDTLKGGIETNTGYKYELI